MVTHEIIGDDMQAVILSLTQGDAVRAEAGAMMFMTDGVEMDAKMDGGLLGGLKRKLLVGESFFITYFRCAQRRRARRVRRAVSRQDHPDRPEGSQILCQKDSFLCAVGDIDISVAFTRVSAPASSAARGSSCRSWREPGSSSRIAAARSSPWISRRASA